MNHVFEKIAVIGLGYIGLPTAAMLAARGMNVIGVDIDKRTVDTINAGKVHIVEPDLDILVRGVVMAQNLRAVCVPEPADAFLITVPTPFKDIHSPDLSFVEAAVQSIAPVLKKNDLIILESTSPVGTTEQIAKQLAALRPDLNFPHQQASGADIYIAYCPERVMPGHIIHELIENDRIIGGMTDACTEKAKTFYQQFVKGQCLTTDSRTAEMAKLTENAFRDVNIAFANELSIICDKLHIDVWELIKLANHHPRVSILQPGPGVGGHCIAVDPWFIVNAAPEEARLIRTAREVNDSKPQFVINKINATAVTFKQPTIACLGLSYKSNTDDLRESPAIKIVEALADYPEYRIHIVEPNIRELPASLAKHPLIKLMPLEEAITSADIIVLMVCHDVFKKIDITQLQDKFFINVANINNQMGESATSYKQTAKPVSEYGLMMMNRIYGQVFT